MKILIKKKFVLNILIPTLLTEVLFVILIFAVIVPDFQKSLIDAKKEMIKEIVNSSVCIIQNEYDKTKLGLITEYQAKKNAIDAIESIRYGAENKDYIWITDETPIMIMHPYRTNLNGKNVKDFKDPNGYRMFFEMVKKVKKDKSGYIDYQWQWMDDSTRIVPKISYITEFREWKWIIGTGVYIEDIREDIAGVTNSLILTSLSILLLSAFLMWIIIKQNIRIERKRKIAEEHLNESKEKYKALVEASDDGTLMFLDNICIFKNKKAEELIDCSNSEVITPNLNHFIPSIMKESISSINQFLEGNEISQNIETKISSKELGFISVLLSFTRISLAEKDSLIVRIRNLQPFQINDMLNSLLNDIFSNITERFNIGVFRAIVNKKAIVTEANSTFFKIFNISTYQELSKINLFELFNLENEASEFHSSLYMNCYIRDFIGTIIDENGEKKKFRISAILNESKDDGTIFIDGFITDNYHSQEINDSMELLFNNDLIQNNLNLLKIKDVSLMPLKEIRAEVGFDDLIELFRFHSTDLMFFRKNNYCYVLYFNDLLFAKFKGNENELETLTEKLILGKNCLTIEYNLHEAIEIMNNLKKDYIICQSNDIYYKLELRIVFDVLYHSEDILKAKINESDTFSSLVAIHNSLPLLVKYLVNISSDIDIITKRITLCSDGITKKIIEKSILELGNPPINFAFISLGSEGRKEQGLTTDQDNAIIYEDNTNINQQEITEYFQSLAKLVNLYLDKVGYKLCTGDIMALNPKWNQSLKTWKNYFNNWILTPDPQNLMESVIFFDFRLIYGDQSLVDNLRFSIKNSIKNNNVFLYHLANTTINYKLPVGLFGKIHTENKDKNIEKFNLKNALRLLVSIIRLYSMKFGIDSTNTLERLERLYNERAIPQNFYREMKYCYNYLMNIQFINQTNEFDKGYEISNYIDLSLFTPIELSNFKSVLSAIANFQTKVKYDFGITN